MRNAWRFFFNRTLARSNSAISRIKAPNLQVRSSELSNPSSHFSVFLAQISIQSPRNRYFSSEPAIHKKYGKDIAIFSEIFSKPTGSDEVKAKLESLNLSLDQEMVHSVIQSLEESPETAMRFFDWVLERETKENRLLRSKSYNLMLEIMGRKGKAVELAVEFCVLKKIMEEKGYGVSKDTFLKLSERFKNEGMEKSLKLLNGMYCNSSSHNVATSFGKLLLKEEGEPEVIHSKLQGLGGDLSSDLVVSVLDELSSYPKKALVFFQWVEENPSFEMDGRVFNAMARVLGRQDSIRDFWEILDKMRNCGFEMERETYVKVLNRFVNRKMISLVVILYEFAMQGSKKPPLQDFVFLLKKIVVSKDLNMSLVTKMVQIFTVAGNSIKGSAFERVLKSLRSVGRLAECDNILKAMEAGGFVADASVYGHVVVGLCAAGKLDESLAYADSLEKSGTKLDHNTWSSLVQKNAFAGKLDKASACFKKMVESKGGENVGSALEVLIHEFCQKKSAEDAAKILKEMVTKRNVKPWHNTYNYLIEKLVGKGSIKEASGLLELMKSNGFPPFIDPFIRYVLKFGTANDAMIFLKALTVNEFPCTTMFIGVFKALLMEGRHQMAHDLLSLSPDSIRNHADVLDLFHSVKPDETVAASALVI